MTASFSRPTSPQLVRLTSAPPSAGPANSAGIYTIPEKYLPRQHIAGPSHKRLFIIAGIVVVVVIGVIGIAVYALQVTLRNAPPTPPPTTNTTPTANTNTPTTNATTTVNTLNAVNGDANSNANINVNATNTVNGDVNENTNESVNKNINTTTTTNTASPLQVVTNAADKDRDGLTDEEEALYGTKVSLPDTDKDGFVDGTEVANLYSPLKAEEKLKKSGMVVEYKNPAWNWSILYPTAWAADSVDGTQREVLFTSDTTEGEFIEVLITDNPKKQTAAEWYVALYDDKPAAAFSEVNVAGLSGIVTSNGLTYYLASGDIILGLVYNVGTTTEAHFLTSFAMMVKSFTFTPPPATATATP